MISTLVTHNDSSSATTNYYND